MNDKERQIRLILQWACVNYKNTDDSLEKEKPNSSFTVEQRELFNKYGNDLMEIIDGSN